MSSLKKKQVAKYIARSMEVVLKLFYKAKRFSGLKILRLPSSWM